MSTPTTTSSQVTTAQQHLAAAVTSALEAGVPTETIVSALEGYATDLRRLRSAAQPRRTLNMGRDQHRRSVGLPGHCGECARLGHEVAHPNLGCADVGCEGGHAWQV